MKTQAVFAKFTTFIATSCLLIAAIAHADGIPEPGLVMYGAVRNIASGNTRLIAGTITWTISPSTGAPVTVTTQLSDISGQYSYALRVPFETIAGSSTLSPNTLSLKSASTSYLRTNIVLTVNGINYPATISAPAFGSFLFNTATRGQMEEVNLTVNAPGVGVPLVKPSFASPPGLVNGKFQLTVNGTVGQNYTLLGSTDLITWTPINTFVCTNSTIVVSDPSTTNSLRRFYRIAQ